MPLEIFWGGAPIPQATGRDQAIAEGAELEELGYGDFSDESEDEVQPDYYNPQTGEHSRKRQSRAASNRAAKRRVPGGIAPIQKKITTDYDSDDARIIELKQQLYSDDYVANKLQEEGRMRYSSKTISSRWLRLRKLMDEKEEQKLDDELSDWHVGEDDTLKNIADDIEKKYEQLRQNLEIKKWKEISAHLADKLGKKKYTGKACRERFEGVKKGTALLPIELDQDQAGRRKMREERIAAAKKARKEEEDAKRKKEKDRAERLEAKKREDAEANQKKVIEKLKKQAEKAELARIKEERQVNKEKARQQKLRILTQMRLEREWTITKTRAEKQLYARLTGKEIDGKPARSRSKKDGYESDDMDDNIDDLESDEEEARLTEDEEEGDADSEDNEDEDDEPMVENPAFVRRSGRSSKPVPNPMRSAAISSSKKEFVRVPVTEESLLNPRSVLNITELDAVLFARGLPRRQNETHAEVVARIAAADDTLKSDELDQLLAHEGEKTKGKKADKVRRLQEADAKKSRMGEMGLTSTDVDFMETYEAFKEEANRPILERVRQERNDSVME